LYGIVQTVTGVKKKSAAGVKGKKSSATNAEKEEPMEKELTVSYAVFFAYICHFLLSFRAIRQK